MTDRIGDQHVVTVSEHVNQSPSSLEIPTSQPQSVSKQKFPPGVRLGKKRKPPYVAEVRPNGVKDKVWLGSFPTVEAAARAVDAGNHYYNRQRSFNFADSLLHLQPLPPNLDGKVLKKFVKEEAHKLASLAKGIGAILSGSRPSQSTSFTTSNQSWDVGSVQESYCNCIQLVPSANFAQDLPRWGDFRPQLNSSSDNDVGPTTQYGGVCGQEPGGSSSSEYLRFELEEAVPSSEWIQYFLDQNQFDSPSRWSQ